MIYKTGSSFKILKTAAIVAELDLPKEIDEEVSKEAIIEKKDGRFLYAWTRAVTADVENGNGDLFPLDELKKCYKTFIGRNLFLDHNSGSVANAVGKVAAVKLMYDDIDRQFYVGALMKVDKMAHPDIATKIETGTIDSVSMGASVEEAECNICGVKASTKEQFCKHMNHLGRIDPESGKKIISINRGVTFTELSLVSVPADPTARIKNILASLGITDEDKVKKIASMIEKKAEDDYAVNKELSDDVREGIVLDTLAQKKFRKDYDELNTIQRDEIYIELHPEKKLASKIEGDNDMDLRKSLEKLTGLDFVSLVSALKVEAAPMDINPNINAPIVPNAAPPMAPALDIKPIKPIEPKKEMPKVEAPKEVKKEEPKVEPKKEEKKDLSKVEEPGSSEWEKTDCKNIEEILALLKKLEERETKEGESGEVKALSIIIKKMEALLKKEEKEVKKVEKEEKAEKKEEVKEKKEEKKEEKVEPKKEEVKKEEPKKEAPVKKEEPKKEPMKEKAMDLHAIFIKKDPIEASKWLLIDRTAGKVVLRADLQTLFGDGLKEKMAEVSAPEFGTKLAAVVTEKGVTKEAVMELAASYKPCYPTENKMKAPPISEHPKAKEKAEDGTDVESSPLPKKSDVTPAVEKKAADAPLEKDTIVSPLVGGDKAPKGEEHTDQDASGHKKETKGPKTETDLESSPVKADKKEDLPKVADKKEEITLKAEIAKMHMENNLREKMATCKDVIELMVSKGLFKVQDTYIKAALDKGANIQEAKKIAYTKSVEDQVKRFLQMDNDAITAFKESIDSIEKVAAKAPVSDKLKDPIRVQSSVNEQSFIDKSNEWPWS